MLKYFVTTAQFIFYEGTEAGKDWKSKVCVPVNLQREDSLPCSARVSYEEEALEAVYLLTIRLGKIFHMLGFDDCLLTVSFPDLPWKVVDVAPVDALVVPNDAQGIMEVAAACEVSKLADFFWEINQELD